MTIASLSEFSAADVDKVGGKGANLGELIQNGFPIPPAFVICADEYAQVIASLGPEDSHDAFRNALREWEFKAEFSLSAASCHSILASHRQDEIVYAVRSSATAEDLGDASFAGQHETYYYVTFAELLPMIKACWLSLWSDAAISYRETQGIAHHEVLMAVVVQEMITSYVSGITFTANPLNGNHDEIVSDATWGMGAAIVDGRVTPDHFVVNRQTRQVIQQKIANKRQMVSTTRPTEGGRMIAVPHHQQQKTCLSDEQIQEVTRWGLKAESHFGTPQDLEWAIFDNKYYMLQSRPITTLAQADDEPEEKRKLVVFKAFSENFTEPLTPLTSDILGSSNVVLIYKGWVYQDIRAIKFLLPLKMTDEQAAEILSWELPKDFKIRVNWLMLPVSIGAWLALYLLLGISMARSRRMPDDFMEIFRDRVREVIDDPALTPAAAVIKLFSDDGLNHPIGRGVIRINGSAVLRYFLLMGVINKLLSLWLPNIGRDAGSLLCSGSFGVKSTDMGRNIFKLSVIAKQSPAVISAFEQYPPDQLLDILRNMVEAAEFVTALDEFLAEHGHRALKEFDMVSVRFEENPAPVLGMIRNYFASDSNPDEMAQHTTDLRVDLAARIQTQLTDKLFESTTHWRWKLLEYLSDRCRHFIKLRENSRFYHIMAWNAARKKILKAESALVDSGKLKVKNDIFFLHWVEVRALQDGHLNWPDVEEIIRSRRMRQVRWTKQGAPKFLNIESTRQTRVVPDDQLAGQGASPGRYEGIARVIMDPSVDANIKPGEILIAPYTDPAWTPLFLVARAAVVGVGSYLSHAGTIAREYGMPCVVDVEGCTERIRSGDRILVDGTEGIIELLPALEES
jgi:phosphohistidine swiveling domain-containing protein